MNTVFRDRRGKESVCGVWITFDVEVGWVGLRWGEKGRAGGKWGEGVRGGHNLRWREGRGE